MQQLKSRQRNRETMLQEKDDKEFSIVGISLLYQCGEMVEHDDILIHPKMVNFVAEFRCQKLFRSLNQTKQHCVYVTCTFLTSANLPCFPTVSSVTRSMQQCYVES